MRQKSWQRFTTETRRHGGEPRSGDTDKLWTRQRRQDQQDSQDESQTVQLGVGFILSIPFILSELTISKVWTSPCLRASVVNFSGCLRS